jgi:hypothetical protein
MPTFVVGDVHGHVEPLVDLLRTAGLVDQQLAWSGADARVWFIGDLVDRGPDGIGAIDLVMRLQQDGDVHCVLGNHEAGILAAHRHWDVECSVPGVTFGMVWHANGGVASDLTRLRPEHLAWIEGLPAVAREGDWLLVHSDTDGYLRFGSDVETINRSVSASLVVSRPDALDAVLETLTDRGVFADSERLRAFLTVLGAERVVHGHTPIWYARETSPSSVTEAFRYAGGQALNVDHCLFAGGPGFVTELSSSL